MEKHAFDPACCLGERLQTLSRAELTALAETICRILTERGAYHGGIRPDNISRTGDGTVGLGAPARTDTKDWTTEELEFMAPEVFWSGSLDASADVYSLGLLLYAGVMGGRLPFYPDDRAPQPEDMAAALRRRMDEYGDVCRRIAARENLPLVDTQAAFDRVLKYRHSSYITWDRVHPNIYGATVLARAFLEAVGFDYNRQ